MDGAGWSWVNGLAIPKTNIFQNISVLPTVSVYSTLLDR